MTVLSAVQAACVQSLAIRKPDTLFAGTGDRTQQELVETANAAAKYILREYDWQKLKFIATITGDGVTEDFNLPSAYDRMILKTGLWSSRMDAPLRHVSSDDEWLGLVTMGTMQTYGAWILYADQIHIRPAPASGETVKYFYISNLVVRPATGNNKTAFTMDSDTFILDERLLQLGITWLFKQQKGLAYEEDLNTYQKFMEQLISRDKGSTVIKIGTNRVPTNVDVSYPFNVGV